MIFSSSVFLFVFLPAVLLVYFISPKKLRNTVLLLASLFFYAWGEPVNVLVMIASILVNYGVSLWMDKSGRGRKPLLVLLLLLNLGTLFWFKYLNFAVDTLSAITGAALNGVCAVRDIMLLITEKKRTDKLTTILAVIFSAAVVAIGVATWSSWVSVLFIVAMVLNTVALSIPNPNTVRLFIMMSAPFACAYDILTHSIGGTVNETVSFLSALTAFIRCRRQEKKE